MWGFIQLLDINAHTRYIGWCSSLNRCRCLRGLPLLLLTKPEQTKLMLVCRVVRLCPRQPLDPLDNSSVQTRLMGPPGHEWVFWTTVAWRSPRVLFLITSLHLTSLYEWYARVWMCVNVCTNKTLLDYYKRLSCKVSLLSIMYLVL